MKNSVVAIALMWIAIAYARYYRFVTLGSSEGVELSSETLAKGMLFFGVPFTLLAAGYPSWKFRHSAILSGSLWLSVYLFHAVFGWKEFLLRHPDSYQCVATLFSVYLGMGMMMIAGHGLGAVIYGLRPVFKR